MFTVVGNQAFGCCLGDNNSLTCSINLKAPYSARHKDAQVNMSI